ncbi:hypothetical protein FS749_007854 [Ceratobasidium sp. UAMH 11750]|nr:hypothetical protein FS749_007854 [Ceratobasidium sp. UAMH 11750]
MFFTCKADYVAYALLSRFDTVAEQERDVVQYILELIPCYDTVTGKLRMTRDAHILAQIYLAQLRVLARWHSYVHEGSLEDPAQARALLSVVVIPLVRHLSTDEYEDILESMHEAEALLSLGVAALNVLVERWNASHMELRHQWRTDPIDGGNEWYYGYVLSVSFRIEDVVTPLPYPVKEERSTCETRDEDSDGFELVDGEVVEAVNGKERRRKLRKTQRRRGAGKVVEVEQTGKQAYITLPLMADGMASSSSWSSTESEIWTAVEEPEAKADEIKWEKVPDAGRVKGGAKLSLKTLLRLG